MTPQVDLDEVLRGLARTQDSGPPVPQTAAARMLADLARQDQAGQEARRTGLYPGWITLTEARALARDAGIPGASDAVLLACLRGEIAGARRKGQGWIMTLEYYLDWEATALYPPRCTGAAARVSRRRIDVHHETQTWCCVLPVAVLGIALVAALIGCL